MLGLGAVKAEADCNDSSIQVSGQPQDPDPKEKEIFINDDRTDINDPIVCKKLKVNNKELGIDFVNCEALEGKDLCIGGPGCKSSTVSSVECESFIGIKVEANEIKCSKIILLGGCNVEKVTVDYGGDSAERFGGRVYVEDSSIAEVIFINVRGKREPQVATYNSKVEKVAGGSQAEVGKLVRGYIKQSVPAHRRP